MNTQPNRLPRAVEPSHFVLRERYFWQSRSSLRDPPQLANLHDLAVAIKRTWPCSL